MSTEGNVVIDGNLVVKGPITTTGSITTGAITTTGPITTTAITTGAITSTTAVPLNTWSYISVTRTSGVMAQYINATLAGTTATYATSIANSIGLAIGGTTNNNAAGAFLGYIADLRITKGYARTITVPSLQMQLK
jgi:hypothetical protein